MTAGLGLQLPQFCVQHKVADTLNLRVIVKYLYKNVPYKNIRYIRVWLADFVCKIKNITVEEYSQ